MTKRISEAYWIWGQFDLQSTKQLNKIYKAVNHILNGPHFDTHLTISGPLNTDLKAAKTKFDLLRGKFKKLSLLTNKYAYKKTKYESLYIKIIKSNDLVNLKFKLDEELCVKNRSYDPHISLFYGEEKNIIKKKIIEKLNEPPTKIILNKLSLVYVNESANKWKIIDTFKL